MSRHRVMAQARVCVRSGIMNAHDCWTFLGVGSHWSRVHGEFPVLGTFLFG